MASSAQHVHQQRLAEAARADEEEILVAGLNLGDEAALIDIVAVVEAHGLPVLHPVGDAFWCLCSHSLQLCRLEGFPPLSPLRTVRATFTAYGSSYY